MDISLLAPQSYDLVEGLLDKGNLNLIATRQMLKALTEKDTLEGLCTFGI